MEEAPIIGFYEWPNFLPFCIIVFQSSDANGRKYILHYMADYIGIWLESENI